MRSDFVLAFFRGVEAADDDDQPPAILDGRADEAVARFLDESGFHAVRADAEEQQRIAVDELMLAVGKFLLAEHGIMLRVLADEESSELTELAGRSSAALGLGSPVAFPKVDFLRPMRRASSVISLAKLSSDAGDALGD